MYSNLYTAASSRSYDFTYLLIIIALFIISMIVQSSVNGRYKKYAKVYPSSGLSGAEAAQKILEANGIYDVRITTNQGRNLSDCYDPKSNMIYLSADTFSGRSISAIGVACHEAGHAIQAAREYGPFKLRMWVIPFASISSKAAIPLILAGLILSIFAPFLKYLALAGIILYAVAVFFQLVTLPVEFDASRRALVNIRDEGLLNAEEQKGAKSILSAAAMTYVVATLVSVVQLLRFISILNRR